MSLSPKGSYSELLRNAASVLAAFAAIGGALSLAGWFADVPRLKDWDGNGITMKANAALLACASGCALLGAIWGFARRATFILSSCIALLASATLMEHFTGLNFGIDNILVREAPGALATASPGRMGLPASTSFTLLGAGLLLLPGQRTRRYVNVLALVVLFIASISLIGYLYGADQLYALPRYTGIAFQTAIMLAALAMGLLAAVPEHGLARMFASSGGGGAIMRRLVIPMVLLPLVIGSVRLRGQEMGLYDTAFGVALFTLVVVFGLLAVVWWTALGIERASDELKKSHSALQESEERARTAMDASRTMVWSRDMKTGVITRSANALHILGLPDHGPMEKSWEVVHPDDAERVRRTLADAVTTGSFQLDVRMVRPTDQKVLWMHSRGKVEYDAQGTAVRMIGTNTDITERKEAEEAFHRAEERSRHVLESISEGFVAVDADWRFTYMNAKAEVINNIGRDDWSGRTLWEVFPDLLSTPFEAMYRDAMAQRVQMQVEVPIEKPPGIFDVNVFPVADGGLSFYFQDVTHARRAMQELRASDARKEEFLATLAHELRGPLAPLRHMLEILRSEGNDPAVAAEAHATMERQLEQLVLLVDDLLDISRISSGKIVLRQQPVDLVPILKQAVEACQPLIAAGKHALLIEFPSTPMPVKGDPVRLTQIFSNLLNNACKYTDQGGTIALHARMEGSMAVVSVKDTGVGLEQEQFDTIFKLYAQVHADQQRNQGGLGIGLSLVKKLCTMHGGSVAASSAGRNKGSAFTVRLPLTETPATAQEPVPATPAAAGLRILVVDDNKDGALSLAMLMRLKRHTTAIAHDGEEAIQRAEEFKPDVVLLDIGLPKLDGHEVCRRIRATQWGRTMRIVALTGWGQEEDRRRTKDAGFDHHFVKPVDTKMLHAVLEEVAESKLNTTLQ